MKGADSSVRKMFEASNAMVEFIDQEVENYAAQGLRTLVFGYKEITNETIALFEAAHK